MSNINHINPVQAYGPVVTSASQWDSSSNLQSSNKMQFLTRETQYNTDPVNCNGPSYNAPKISTNVNYNNVNYNNVNYNNVNYNNVNYNNVSYNNVNYNNTQKGYVPNYINTCPNGVYAQDVRYNPTYNGLHNPGVMFTHSTCPRGPAGSNQDWNNPYNTGNRLIPIPETSGQKSGNIKKPKRIRTAFTTSQITQLENVYTKNRYLNRSHRMELAKILNLNERTIKIWFQNRRMKEKKDRAESLGDSEISRTSEHADSNHLAQMEKYGQYPQNIYGPGVYKEPYHDQTPVMQPSEVPQNIPEPLLSTYPTHEVSNITDFIEKYYIEEPETTVPMPEYHNNTIELINSNEPPEVSPQTESVPNDTNNELNGLMMFL